jgi:hypothetical protein
MERAQPTPAELRYYGYGDESITDEFIAFGTAIFAIDRIPEAEAIIAQAKSSIGLDQSERLHARVMFHAPARRNTAWEDIHPNDIASMVVRLLEELKKIGERPLIFVSPTSRIVFPGFDNQKSSETRLEDKGVAALGFQGIQVNLVQRYGYGGIKIWVDPDKSKIPWLGGRHSQANSTRSGFVDLGPDIEPPRVTPESSDCPNPKLLEVADLYAYVTAQAYSKKGGEKVRRFQELFKLIYPEQVFFEPAPGTKWEQA